MNREVRIGIYAVVIILLSWAGVRFLSGLQVLGMGATYVAYYEDACGLKPASPVVVRGVKVGQVLELDVDPEEPWRVRAVITLPESYRLPEDTEARIFSDGLMGGKAISLDYGKSDVMLESGAEIRTRTDTDLVSAMASTVGELKQRVTEVMDRLNATLQCIQTVAEESAPGIRRTVDHLGSIAERVDRSAIVSDVEKVTRMLAGQGREMEAIVGDVRRLADTLSSTESLQSLKRSIDNLDGILARIGSGDGTAGRLVTDRELYDSATEASRNLASLLEDIKADPSRYVNVRVFGRSYEEKIKDREAKRRYRAEQKKARRTGRHDAATERRAERRNR